MALYVFEVEHRCAHRETIRYDLDEQVYDESDPAWITADREHMRHIKEDSVCDLCPDCELAQESGHPVIAGLPPEEDFARVPDFLVRNWESAS